MDPRGYSPSPGMPGYEEAAKHGRTREQRRLVRALALLKETQDKVVPPGIAWTEKVRTLLEESDE